jgi:hypothetical protein
LTSAIVLATVISKVFFRKAVDPPSKKAENMTEAIAREAVTTKAVDNGELEDASSYSM